MGTVSVPTVKGMGDAFKKYGIGLMGGAIYSIVAGMSGSGFIGSLLPPLIAGSMLKGEAGDIIATISGFNGAANLLASLSRPTTNAGSPGVM